MVTNSANRLYSDLELSLFSELSSVVDEQEADMVSFYTDLQRRVASLQRYLFANDTALDHFMRRLSIWRMPTINSQVPQVTLRSPDTGTVPAVLRGADIGLRLLLGLRLRLRLGL